MPILNSRYESKSSVTSFAYVSRLGDHGVGSPLWIRIK
jgi:hypothetical protein